MLAKINMNTKIDNKYEIIAEIKNFVAGENTACSMGAIWQDPIVGFADAGSEYIRSLKTIVHPDHQMPEEVIPGAKTVIAYFVPFSRWVAETNEPKNDDSEELALMASPQWAESYELTNSMMARLNEHMIEFIHKMGYEAKTAPEAAVFYRDEVISHWSFRHLAYAAGLGTFGLNNMLITDKGCSGRYNCLVTDLDIEPDKPRAEEACLYKKNGTCKLCMIKCPARAITSSGFDRHKCYEQCLKNAEVYTDFGSSYAGDTDDSVAGSTNRTETIIGSEVCGKCIAGMPCTYKRP